MAQPDRSNSLSRGSIEPREGSIPGVPESHNEPVVPFQQTYSEIHSSPPLDQRELFDAMIREDDDEKRAEIRHKYVSALGVRRVEIPPRTLKPRLYFALRKTGMPWWTCARVMWHGGTISKEDHVD